MSSALLLTIKLKGKISGPKKHTDRQVVTVNVTPIGARFPEVMTKKILHTDRVETECSKKMRLSEELVHEFETSECPHWEKPTTWKNMSRSQRLLSHLKRYDEGYGISFDFIDNK